MEQRREFDIPRAGHVQDGVRLAGERAPDLARHVRFQPLGEQFGEVGFVVRGGEDRVEDGLSGGAVIGVVESVGGKKILRIAGDEDIGLFASDDADDLAAQIQVWDEVAVLEVQKVNRLRADHFRGRVLFVMSQRAQVGGSHFFCGGVVEAFVAAGQQIICDLVSGARPLCQRRAAKKFWIIGMSQNHENVLGGVPDVRFHGFTRYFFPGGLRL